MANKGNGKGVKAQCVNCCPDTLRRLMRRPKGIFWWVCSGMRLLGGKGLTVLPRTRNLASD